MTPERLKEIRRYVSELCETAKATGYVQGVGVLPGMAAELLAHVDALEKELPARLSEAREREIIARMGMPLYGRIENAPEAR